MQTYEKTLGHCRCGAELSCQTDGATYEGPRYWLGGDPYCLHMRILNPERLTMEAAAGAAGLRKGVQDESRHL